ncbi:MAG: hypothetical protein DRI90_17650 [Deltaproteobacteria bacterium]|nr:MAG: hypothetical protein DRI90_17650 [Deltaproteobacteria bacterium]
MSNPLPLTDRELRALLGSFTHDLRNPLSAIVSNLDFATRVADQHDLDPDLVESLTDSVTACDMLRRILANIDLLAAGDQTPEVDQEVLLLPLVDKVVQRCQAQAEQAQISLVLTGCDEPVHARLDAANLALAIENLIADSIVHAPSGSKVAVAIEQGEREILVHVCDQGPAIPSELCDLAVSAEGQLSTGRRPGSRYARGAALLAARAAAETCGGSLSLTPAGNGSRFTIAVPVRT